MSCCQALADILAEGNGLAALRDPDKDAGLEGCDCRLEVWVAWTVVAVREHMVRQRLRVRPAARDEALAVHQPEALPGIHDGPPTPAPPLRTTGRQA